MDRKNTSCEVFSEDFKRYLPIGISSTALLSLAACSVVAILLLCQKMYCAFHHRIILYLLLYTILADASYMLRIVGAFSLTKSGDFNPVFCSISGFLNEYTDLAQLLIQTIVTVHVGCMVLLIEVRCTRPLGHHYLGITTAHETESSSCKAKRYMRRLELVYALSPAVLPLLFAWIPFVTGDYGKAGIWCWIRSTTGNCSELVISGITEQYLLWFIPESVLTLVNTTIIIVTITVITWKFKQTMSAGYKEMLKRVLPILAYPIIFQLLHWFALINRIVSKITRPVKIPALVVMHSIGTASSGLFAAAAFTVYFVVWRNQLKKRERDSNLICHHCSTETSKICQMRIHF